MERDMGDPVVEDTTESGKLDEPSFEDKIEHLRRPTSSIGARLADLIVAYLGPPRPFVRRQARLFSLAVVAAVGMAFWLTRWPLADWPGTDAARYLIHPVLWTGVALLAGFGWRRLEDRPRFSPLLTTIALCAGLVHITTLLVAGIVGSFSDSPLIDGGIDYVLNTLHVATLLAGTELARAYVYNAWKGKNRVAAFGWVSLMFAVVALTAAELTPFDSLDQFLEVAGGRWAPVLALSLIATALAGIGGPGPAFAYRMAVVGLMWLSPHQPDLGWVWLLAIGVVAPWVLWRAVYGIYRLTAEGEQRLKNEPGPWTGALSAILGLIIMSALIIIALTILFGTGVVGFRTQIIVDDAMAPAFERGDLVLVEEELDPSRLEVGDVVRVAADGQTLVRRITLISEGPDGLAFTVGADNVTPRERRITEDQLAGEVILRLPSAGDIVLWWRE